MSTAKKGRGRPRLPEGAVKVTTFSLRLTVDEAAVIKEAAERAGAKSASDWARDVLVAAARIADD